MDVMRFQIGKNGLTPGVLESLELAFKNHSIVRISLLKSASLTRERIAEIAEEIMSSLSGKHTVRIIGFTIILRRQRKNQKTTPKRERLIKKKTL